MTMQIRERVLKALNDRALWFIFLFLGGCVPSTEEIDLLETDTLAVLAAEEALRGEDK